MSKLIIILISLTLLVSCHDRNKSPQNAEMERFLDRLLKEMTLEEKLGQLNLPAVGDIITG